MDNNPKVFEKDHEQEDAIDKISTTMLDAAINGSGTGAGKTYIGIKAAIERGAERILIIGQPKTFENFEATVEALTEGRAKLLPCANSKFRDGTPAAEVKANKEACMRGDKGWYFVSRELFRIEMTNKREWVEKKTGRTKKRTEVKLSWCKKQPFDYVIYDECQMVANAKSQSHKCLLKLRTDFLLIQSADWFGGEIINQWHVAKALWPDWLEREYPGGSDEWITANCTTEYDHFAYNKKRITGEQWPGFFAASMPLYVRIKSPISKPKPEQHFIDLSRAERKLYEDLKKYLAAEIGDTLLSVGSAAELNMRLREALLGVFVPVDVKRKRKIDGETVEVDGQTIEYRAGDKSSTVDAIREIMKTHAGEPVIVLSSSKKWANKAAEDLGGRAYTGDQTEAQKADAERLFMSGEIKVLVGTEAMAEGLDGLQKVCRIAIIASRPSRNYMTPQFIGRIARRGQEREPQVYEIVRRNTIDTVILKGRGKNQRETPGIIQQAIMKELMLNNAKALQTGENDGRTGTERVPRLEEGDESQRRRGGNGIQRAENSGTSEEYPDPRREPREGPRGAPRGGVTMTGKLPKELHVFDTETSGVDVTGARIITCYAARYDQDCNVLREQSWTINPGVEMPEAAAAVHGMTTEWVQENGDPDWEKCITEIAMTLHEANEDGVPIVAFNLPFDFTLLHHEVIRAGMPEGLNNILANGTFYDPLVHERERVKKVSGKGQRKLGNMCARYNIEFNEEDAHAAEYDVAKTAEIAWKFLKKDKLTVAELSKVMPDWQRKQATELESYFARVKKKNDKGEKIVTSKGWPLYTEIGN